MQNAEFRMQNYHLARSLPAARGNENNLRFLRLFCLQVRRTPHTNLSFCILRSEICIPTNRHFPNNERAFSKTMQINQTIEKSPELLSLFSGLFQICWYIYFFVDFVNAFQCTKAKKANAKFRICF